MTKKRPPKPPATPRTRRDDEDHDDPREHVDPPDDEAIDELEATEEDPKSRRAARKAAKEATRTAEQSRLALRKKVRMFYDLQRLRIQMAGRGKPRADHAPIALHEVDIAILDTRSNDLLRAEKAALTDIKDHLSTIAFYRNVLSDKQRYKGLGPTMAAVILSEFDIHREDTASKMWAFAGLAPVAVKRCGRCHVPLTPDGEHAYTKGACASVHQPYDSGKAMRPEKGEKRPYNAFLKTKLVGVLGSCLLKANSPWRKLYDDYKHRKQTAGWGQSDGHRHNAAVRYMVKQLLLVVWREWRAAEGLPVRPSYHEEYQGHVHHGGAQISHPAA